MTTVLPLTSRNAPPLSRLRQASISAPVCRLPLLLNRVPAGFPSPADEYAETALDLNTYLIRNKTATFFFRVIGDSMTGANIHDGDLLVVDRSIEPKHRPYRARRHQ